MNYSENQYKGIIIRKCHDKKPKTGKEYEIELTSSILFLSKEELKNLAFYLSIYLEEETREEESKNCDHRCSGNCRREGCCVMDEGHIHE